MYAVDRHALHHCAAMTANSGVEMMETDGLQGKAWEAWTRLAGLSTNERDALYLLEYRSPGTVCYVYA